MPPYMKDINADDYPVSNRTIYIIIVYHSYFTLSRFNVPLENTAFVYRRQGRG